MTAIKCMLYCTMADPYLYEVSMMQYCGTEYGDCVPFGEKLFFITSEEPLKKGDVLNSDFKKQERKLPIKDDLVVVSDDLNGSVCFECDCKEAFDISKVVQTNKNLSLKIRNVYDTEEVTLYRGLKTALTLKQIEVYQGTSKRLFAIHLENVHLTKPFHITQLYRDGTMVYPLTGAPQSYCFAYRKLETTKEDYLSNVGKADGRYYFQKNGKFFYSEKVLVLSIQSPWLCKIGNGEKDLEIRKSCPKEIKEMEK